MFNKILLFWLLKTGFTHKLRNQLIFYSFYILQFSEKQILKFYLSAADVCVCVHLNVSAVGCCFSHLVILVFSICRCTAFFFLLYSLFFCFIRQFAYSSAFVYTLSVIMSNCEQNDISIFSLKHRNGWVFVCWALTRRRPFYQIGVHLIWISRMYIYIYICEIFSSSSFSVVHTGERIKQQLTNEWRKKNKSPWKRRKN